MQPRGLYQRGGKRVLDLMLVLLSLPLWLPLLLSLMLFLVAPARGRLLFCQERTGYRERTFRLLKLRTMRPVCGEANNAAPSAEAARITPWGHCLRTTGLDELPQLVHVLFGRMSIVGPRPLLPVYLPYYTAPQRQRHSVRPGLTGLAQVKGRNQQSWARRLALDSYYARNYSLALDCWILCQTLRQLLSRQPRDTASSGIMPRFDHVQQEKGKHSA
jgi:lipopolysaccharide/colanic/teichoic acid biosynthesis glycosyltransferase